MMPLQGAEGGKNGVDHFDINSTVLNAYASETSSTSKASSSTRCSNPTDLNANSREEQLESTRAEMGEVREENERLKTLLATIMEDYRSLQSRILNVTQQTTDRSLGGAGDSRDVEEQPDHDHLVSLRLGTTSTTTTDQTKNTSDIKQIVDDDRHQGLSLGLQQTSTASDHSQKRLLRQNQTAPKRPDDPDEASRQIHGKKARVSVRARCDTPTMMDGCQWRKYGQKISKGNPCPRAYYRCTVAPACPVRKQVQRCSDDMSILITTYEGTHNHPLPMGATAMASTTSAAATMLMSGSSNSGHPGVEVPIAMPMTCSTTNSALLNGLNFSSGLRQYYQPPNPTITLDLTSPTTATPHLNTLLSQTAPRYSSTNFNFSPMGYPNTSLQHSNTPWSNSSGLNNVMNIGNQMQQRTAPPSFLQKPAGQSSDQKISSSSGSGNLTYTIAKAITTDPSFQSSIKDAINSFVSNGNRKEVGGGHVGSFFKRIDGSSGGSSAANQHQANQMLLQSSLELSAPKASSSSPVDQAREHIMKN